MRQNKEYYDKQLKHGLLTREEERELFLRIKKGDALAMDEIILHNQRLIRSIAFDLAAKYQMELEDLSQEGNLGLLKAIEKFDIEKGNKFSTYATWWIRQSITRYIDNHRRPVRLPVHITEKIKKIRKVSNELTLLYGNEPSIDEVADVLDMTPEQVRLCLQNSTSIMSLDEPVKDMDVSLEDLIGTDENTVHDKVMYTIMKEEFMKILDSCDSRTKDVLIRHYGINGRKETLLEIGESYNISRERVRQIERNALDRLRIDKRVRKLRVFVE